MSYDRTELRAKFLDRERARKMPDSTLAIVLNAGTADEDEIPVEDGWYPFKERNRADPNSLYAIEVTARDELTSEVMGQADRLKLDGVPYQFNYDPPLAEPRVWMFYATELKTGGLR